MAGAGVPHRQPQPVPAGVGARRAASPGPPGLRRASGGNGRAGMSGSDGGRRRRRLALVALVPLLVAGCSSPPPPEVTMTRGIAYTAGAELDVHARAGAARQPVLVLLHGCCGSRDDLTPLAEAIAA